jgi:hypothetical protein
MTPEQTLDWLAEQHKSQCNEDRPIQEWIRSMKSMLPAPVQEPVADVYMAGSMKTNIGTNGRVVYVSTVYSEKPLAKGDKLYTTPPAAPVQPVAMRMPKVGDKVVCIEDESLGTVVYLTAGGSPEIKFDDGSHGTYMLREFAELFGYTTPHAAKRQWVGLTDAEVMHTMSGDWTSQFYFARAIEAKLKKENT